MSFDFSTLVTDRTQADVSRVKQIAEKIKNGTASESELAEFNGAAMKGAYNHTDLNRVTAAMESLKAKLEGYGYAVPGYQRIKVPHVVPEPEPTSRLPEGYTELSYIESTGTQYIDTGLLNKPGYTINTRFKIPSGVSGCDVMIAGGRTYDSAATDARLYYISIYNAQWVIAYADVGLVSGHTVLDNTIYDVSSTLAVGKQTVVANGEKIYETASTATFNSTRNVELMGASHYTAVGHVVMYSCQIYDSGTLIRNYVPCINPDGAVGLYDLVTAAFFGNSGTGSFVAGAIPRELPEGYTQVEYIQSSGTQYVDTGFKPNQNTRVVMDVQATSANTYAYFGGRNGSLSKSFTFFMLSANAKTIRYDYGSTEITATATSLLDRVVIDANKNTFNYGGVTGTHSTNTFQSDYAMFLFAVNNGGKVAYQIPAKLHSCQMYDNGVLVRDFVPCKNSGGVFGLYDIANDVFYQNAGSGTFAAGEEVVAPATASVMVASSDLTEYDPYTWYEFDWPTPESMTIYLLNVSAIRAVLVVLRSTPEVPTDMERLMAQEANNIEAILLDVCRQLSIMPTTFIPCGEALCGGDNL